MDEPIYQSELKQYAADSKRSLGGYWDRKFDRPVISTLWSVLFASAGTVMLIGHQLAA